jgi:hypothetical protein
MTLRTPPIPDSRCTCDNEQGCLVHDPLVKKCPNCENGSGYNRHLGAGNDEVVEDCQFHLVPDKKIPHYTGKDPGFTVACNLAEARDKLEKALIDLKELGPGSVLPWLRITILKTTVAMEACAMADSHICRNEGYKNGMRDARNGCVCDKQPGKCPAHDILLGRKVEGLGTDE